MALQLFIKKPKNIDIPAVLYIRYSFRGSETLFSTGQKIRRSDWDSSRSKPKRNFQLEKLLRKKIEEISDIIIDVQNENLSPIPDLIKQRYNTLRKNDSKDSNLVLSSWEEFLENKRKNVSAKTIQGLTASYNSFSKFLEEQRRIRLSFAGLTKTVIDQYADYLSKANYKPNTIAKKLKHIKEFLTDIKHPVVSHIKFKETPSSNVYLTEDELRLFEEANLDVSPQLEEVRDLFVFQCNTGLRVSDLKRIARAHLQGDTLTIRAKKNRNLINYPITPSLKLILEKYNGELPKLPDPVYNRKLKELARQVIPESTMEVSDDSNREKPIIINKYKLITSHVAVSTFITLRAKRGMPIPSIAVLTGKTIEVILKHYLGLNSQYAYEDALKYDRNN